MATYYCRICWNENGWRYPSGMTGSDRGYAGEHHFGHEEWLFNFSWTCDDGFHYAFLQPVNRAGERRRGEVLDLVLWTQRLEAGRINDCRILTTEEARRALSEYKKKGWYRQMQMDVDAVGGRTEDLDWDSLTFDFGAKTPWFLILR